MSLSLIWKDIWSLFYLATHANIGIATTFSAQNDPQNPDPHLACLHRDLDDSKDLVVAHKTLPCKSRVWIYNPRTKRSVVAIVGDRGPRRAALDMSVATTKAIKANGFETVLFVPIKSIY